MQLNAKKIMSRTFGIIAVYSAFAYIFAHLAYMNMDNNAGIIFEYVTYYLDLVTKFVVPIAVAVATLTVYVYQGTKSAVGCALGASLGRVFFTIPYYYIVFIYNYGYDSLESLSLSLIAAIGIVLFTAGGAFLEIAIAWLLLRRQGRRYKRDFDTRLSITESLEKGQSYSNFTNGANRAILWFAIFRFVRNIVSELIETVLFFTEYGLDYSFIELISIMSGYILFFVLIITSYLLAVWYKKHIMESCSLTNEE